MKSIYYSSSAVDKKALQIAQAMRDACTNAGFTFRSESDWPWIAGAGSDSRFEQIKQASLVIAVLGSRTTSVLLELGYALGMGKAVILVTDLASDLPFDLSAIKAIDSSSAVEEVVSKLIGEVEKLKDDQRPKSWDLPNDLLEMLHLKAEYPERFEQVNPQDFELAVKNAFLQRGYNVEGADPQSDFGYDFKINMPDGYYILVEVKKNSPNGRISIAVIQQILGALHSYNAFKALVVCTSDFTDSARGYAARHPLELELWTSKELLEFAEGRRKF